MEGLNPYVRYIAISDHLPNKDFVKAYDCRFFFVLSGEGELRTDTKSFNLGPNSLVYYPSGVPYFLISSTESPLLFVTLNFDFTRSYPERTTTLRPVKLCDFDQSVERPTHNEVGEECFGSAFVMEHAFGLRDDFISLASHFSKRGAYSVELCSSLLKYIIYKISAHFASFGRENKLIGQVMEYIESECEGDLDNASVAAHFGYHPYYLSSLFKEHTGKTLHKYILEARLRRASDLLLHSDMSLGDVATRCGFANVNHFSVKFKQQYEQTPAKWRCRGSVI